MTWLFQKAVNLKPAQALSALCLMFALSATTAAAENVTSRSISMKAADHIHNADCGFPSQNFNTVCTLAGFDPHAAHERLRLKFEGGER